jgi:hypothetical protein
MPARWLNRFELKPGRWVYVPTEDARDSGLDIKRRLEKRWAPPDYYFHLQKGGHVAALRTHLGNSYFLRADIQNFFGSINRTRVTRCLKPRVGYDTAREWAIQSTVLHPGGKKITLPYGFVQSQLLASLCLSESALGRCLKRIHDEGGAVVSVYVDDVIVSAPEQSHLDSIHSEILASADRSRFALNSAKSSGPASQVSAFNILLSEACMNIEAARLAEFASLLASSATPSQRQGILAYVASVSPTQLSELLA